MPRTAGGMPMDRRGSATGKPTQGVWETTDPGTGVMPAARGGAPWRPGGSHQRPGGRSVPGRFFRRRLDPEEGSPCAY